LPPRLKVSEWADQHRILSPESASEPGKWHTSRVEYLRDIMDAFNDPAIETIVFKKSSQVGGTEFLLNVIGYIMDCDPGPILIVTPDINTAQSWSKDRLAPMLRDTQILRGKVTDSLRPDSDNTVSHKSFPGGHLTLVGANSPSGLAMRPIRYLIFDEVDRFKASAKKEGDPVRLATARTKWFRWNRKIILVSTPTIRGQSRIDNAWEISDKRHFRVPCPHCGSVQSLEWKQVKWTAPHGNGNPDTARYWCADCNEPWTDVERWAAIRQGSWEATATSPGVAGFFVNEFYSPLVKLADIVVDFLEAKPFPEELKVWTNTVLGETWEERGVELDYDALSMRREPLGPPPPVILLITVGVDVQANRLEAVRIGWGMQEEAYVLEQVIFHGDPSAPQVWEQLDDYLLTGTKLADGRTLRVMAACVDSGGHYADATHTFCRAKLARRVYSIKGDDGARPIWPRNPSQTNKGTNLVYIVGVDSAKDIIYGRLNHTKTPGPGYFHFSDGLDPEFFQQLTSETIVTKIKSGMPIRTWQLKDGMRNEALDCVVYAFAALRSMPISWDRVKQKQSSSKMSPQEAVSGGVSDPPPPAPAPVYAGPPSPPQPQPQRPPRIARSTFITGGRNRF
jgi:phage terminase large subunit GpA-like protein